MSSKTDIELMQQLRGGSETALQELIERHRKHLYLLAYRLLGDTAAASDTVQETFIRLWQHARRFDPNQNLTTWLCTICARRCYDELRRQRRHRIMLANLPIDNTQPDAMASEELLTLLQYVTASLPPKQRIIYQLREIECLSTEEVADVTRMSVDQVKANLSVARKTVREKMKQHGIQ